MTPQTIITGARDTLNDSDASAYRNSDAELLRYANDGLGECSRLAPNLFYATSAITCAVGETEQSMSFADAQEVVDVIRIVGGRAILPGDMAALSAFNPEWGQDDPGPAQNWFRHAGDPLRFYLYPKAPIGQEVELKYVRIPAAVGLNDEITDLPAALQSALEYYVIARASAKEAEHVNAGTAALFMQAFVAKITSAPAK